MQHTILPQTQIIAFGYHDQSSPRHRSVCETFRREGSDIMECHTEAGGLIGKYCDLWRKYRQLRASSFELRAFLVTFPGHSLMPLAWFLARLRSSRSYGEQARPRLIFDAFISLYDTNVSDRKRVPFWHPRAWLWYLIDVVSCHLADEVIVDTEEHKKYFVHAFKLNPQRIRVIYLEAHPDLFFPKPTTYHLPPTTSFNVLFYGSFIPLHGIEHILHTAKIVQERQPQIHFTLIGKGQTLFAMQELARSLRLTNITFVPPVPLEHLPSHIHSADLCLGIFGTSAKVQRVIPHKVLDAIACGVPVITADTPAIRERFADHPLVHLVPAGNAEEFACRILSLYYYAVSTIPSACCS